MLMMLIQCKVYGDDDSYEELKQQLCESHILELKIEALKGFIKSENEMK